MAPSAPMVLVLIRLSSADLDEHSSLLQMPVVEKSVATDGSDCACPGYYEEQCTENAFQGCIWTDAGDSNAPWCQCDPDFVPTPPLVGNIENCGIVTRAEGEWTDEGYNDVYRGWYDVSGCGSCNDYCRWVGNGGSGGDPAAALTHGVSWWSCRLAGTNEIYSPQGHFSSWSHQKCDDSASCDVVTRAEGEWTDEGYNDVYRGWYDVSGCGSCNDYCRWVGNGGSGGDPAAALTHGVSWWSCRLAGTNEIYSPQGHFSSWSHQKCPAPSSTLAS